MTRCTTLALWWAHCRLAVVLLLTEKILCKVRSQLYVQGNSSGKDDFAHFEGLKSSTKFLKQQQDGWQEIDYTIWKSALYTCRNEETSSGITYKLR